MENKFKQLEKKVDRILALLEGEDSSTSLGSLEIGQLHDLPDDVLKRNKLGRYAQN